MLVWQRNASLEAGFPEKSEHILFIGLHAGLVEGVDTEGVTADAAGKFEEVDELAKCVFVDVFHLDFEHGYAARDVGFDSALHSAVVNFGEAFVDEVVDAVEVLLVGGHGHVGGGLLHM